MSSQTPNIGLTLPTGSENVSRQIINDNNTKIDTAIGGTAGRELLGYKENGDTASQAIADGSFVVWKGDLYKANGAISQGTAFSSSNLTAVPSGGFNDLQGQVSTLSDSINNLDYFTLINSEAITPTLTTVNLYQGRNIDNYKYALAVVKRGTYYRASMLLPTSIFYGSGNFSLTEVDSTNTQRWYEIKYVDSTSVTIQASSNVSDATIRLYGINMII